MIFIKKHLSHLKTLHYTSHSPNCGQVRRRWGPPVVVVKTSGQKKREGDACRECRGRRVTQPSRTGAASRARVPGVLAGDEEKNTFDPARLFECFSSALFTRLPPSAGRSPLFASRLPRPSNLGVASASGSPTLCCINEVAQVCLGNDDPYLGLDGPTCIMHPCYIRLLNKCKVHLRLDSGT